MALPPPYRIETDRVVLRPWALTDAAALQRLVEQNQAHLAPWMIWALNVPSLDEELALVRSFRARYDRDEDYVMGVFLEDGRAIGGTGFHRRVGPDALEIGYWISAEFEGQGLVTEWVAGLCRVGFEVLGVERLNIHCDPLNTRSAAVPQRLGFTDEALLRMRSVGVDGRMRDVQVFTLLRAELEASAAATATVRAWDALERPLL